MKSTRHENISKNDQKHYSIISDLILLYFFNYIFFKGIMYFRNIFFPMLYAEHKKSIRKKNPKCTYSFNYSNCSKHKFKDCV